MSLCKLEFFEKKFFMEQESGGTDHFEFECVHHDLAEIEEIDDDYLAPEESEATISWTDKVTSDLILVISGEIDFLGYVTKVSTEDDQTVVSFKPLIAMFDTDVLFPVNHQEVATRYLEQDISEIITEFFTNNGDWEWCIANLIVTVKSQTPSYQLGFTADSFAQNRCKVNLLEDVLQNALTYYGIVIVPEFQWLEDDPEGTLSNGSGFYLTLTIGTNSAYPLSDETHNNATIFDISADNPLVKVESFTIDSSSESANALKVYSTANTTLYRIFYLHDDGRDPPYDHLNENRIKPVRYALEYASGTGTTFYNPNNKTGTAMNKCKSFFKNLTWKSNIELRVSNDDALIKPWTLKIGQICRIWYNGKSYESILTGKKYGEDTVLIFGTVRTTLTKQMKLKKKK